MTELVLTATGTPAPQGSKKGFYNHRTQRVQMVESSKKVKPWRQDVVASVDAIRSDVEAGFVRGVELPLAGPLEVVVDFYIARPGYHYGTGRNAGVLKPTAPAYVDKKPDADKLLRSTLDGLKEAGVYRDDAQVAVVTGRKHYANAATGARITIRPLSADATTSTPEASATSGTPAEGEANGVPDTRQEVLFP